MGILATKPTEDGDQNIAGAGKSPKGNDNPEKYYKFVKKELPDSQIELEITVNSDTFNLAKDGAFRRLAEEVKIPGFRPGKAPKNLVEAKLGARLYEEAINDLIPTVTAAVLVDAGINPLDYAVYTVKKFSNEDGLEYSAKFTVMPEVKLPDFKKLKVAKRETKIEDKEVEDLFQKLKSDIEAKGKASDKGHDHDHAGHDHDHDHDHAGHDHDHDHDHAGHDHDHGDAANAKPAKAEKSVAKKDDKDIDWAKELGDDTLKSAEDVRKQIKESLTKRRERELEEQYVNDLLEEVIEKAKIDPPKQIVAKEVDYLENNYRQRIEQLGLKVEDFLKTQKTDIEKMREAWEKDATFKISTELLFATVGQEYKIKVEDKEVEEEINKISDEKIKQTYDNMNGRSTIRGVLYRQKALDKLRELIG